MAATPPPDHKFRKTFDHLRAVVADPASTQEDRDKALDIAEEVVDALIAQMPPDGPRVRLRTEPRTPRKS